MGIQSLQGLSEDLSTALERAQSADRLKGEILANLSHELRTPLNALINVPAQLLSKIHVQAFWQCEPCGEVFEDDGDGEGTSEEDLKCPECGGALTTFKQLDSALDPDEILKLLGRTTESGKHLNKTLADILEFAKLESGTEESAKHPAAPKEMFYEATEALVDMAASKSVRLEVEAPDALGLVLVEPEQMAMLIKKLLENAIEFSPEGASVLIEAKLIEERNTVRLSVTDEGPGIAQESMNFIFGSFQQLESGHTRSHPGVGLGLAIAARIASEHKSQVSVDSTLGSGSCFSIEVARAEDSASS